jgi:hypothetical protein
MMVETYYGSGGGSGGGGGSEFKSNRGRHI